MIKEIAFTAYPAADVAKLREFYVDTLGVPLGEAMAGEDGRAAYAEAKIGEGGFNGSMQHFDTRIVERCTWVNSVDRE